VSGAAKSSFMITASQEFGGRQRDSSMSVSRRANGLEDCRSRPTKI
jgi:hypothetical protein